MTNLSEKEFQCFSHNSVSDVSPASLYGERLVVGGVLYLVILSFSIGKFKKYTETQKVIYIHVYAY